ncbi:hypothetical protein [Phenylobacterium sp. J367]|uniref:hypothetical protein n=1 Tax=Phenylobacterium sp. J367 TaxID=2898435 RepID=UPI0021507355|nr:hypothetical protein [Phenylobacterium sp. J367]MCR5877539.1 hypothetical protein [Phenylobacterium sp. J367]
MRREPLRAAGPQVVGDRLLVEGEVVRLRPVADDVEQRVGIEAGVRADPQVVLQRG